MQAHQPPQRRIELSMVQCNGSCCSNLLSQLQVAGLYSLSFLTEGNTLEEGDGLLLPEDAVVLLLQVDKGVASLAMPDVGQTSLHSQPKVVTDHLQTECLCDEQDSALQVAPQNALWMCSNLEVCKSHRHNELTAVARLLTATNKVTVMPAADMSCQLPHTPKNAARGLKMSAAWQAIHGCWYDFEPAQYQMTKTSKDFWHIALLVVKTASLSFTDNTSRQDWAKVTQLTCGRLS